LKWYISIKEAAIGVPAEYGTESTNYRSGICLSSNLKEQILQLQNQNCENTLLSDSCLTAFLLRVFSDISLSLK